MCGGSGWWWWLFDTYAPPLTRQTKGGTCTELHGHSHTRERLKNGIDIVFAAALDHTPCGSWGDSAQQMMVDVELHDGLHTAGQWYPRWPSPT